VIPNAAADRVDGLVARDQDGLALKIRVSAIPDKGKANAAVVKLLAKSWQVPRASLSIVSGEKDRNKTVLLAGNPEDQMAFLAAWFRQLDT